MIYGSGIFNTCLPSFRQVPRDKIMSPAYKLFLFFLYVRSAAIVNTGQNDLSREKGVTFLLSASHSTSSTMKKRG
jgi:hypothetical protein